MLKFYADLHCDTLWRCYEQRRDLSHPALQIKDDSSFIHLQNYAIYIADGIDDSMDYFRKVYDHSRRLFGAHPCYVQCKNVGDIHRALAKGKKPYLLSIEGGCLFNGSNRHDVAVAEELKAKGIAFVSLCYNGGNALAGGAHTPDKSLTDAGKSVVKLLRECGISVDISHLNFRSADEILELLSDGVVATHSNCYSLMNHPRNLKDHQIKELIRKEGLIGLNFYPPFLRGETADSEDVLKHLTYLEALGGEEVIAFGSDFDGIESVPTDLSSSEDLPYFYEKLFSKVGERAEQYCFGNVMRYLERNFK